MGDASYFINPKMQGLANRLRQRAADYRLIASKSNDPSSWLLSATNLDSQSAIILEAMKQGKPMPKVGFGDEPFRG